MNGSIEVMVERNRLPADGRSSTAVRLGIADPSCEVVELQLRGSGSFYPDRVVRERSVPVEDGEANLTVFAPRRPGKTVLSGEGVRVKLEFQPASFMQGLVYEWVPTIVLSLVIALVLKSYAFANILIPSGSMENTLAIDDMLIANKLSYKVLHHEPQRGDVMIFTPHFTTDKPLFIKRVIGLPGETLSVSGGVVHINGEPLDEDYIKSPSLRDFPEVTIPDGEYFMMGDNRNNSLDSRTWGTVKYDQFEGRAMFVFWPLAHARLLDQD